MKRFNWWLIGLVAVCLSMIPLAGCMGVSQSKYEALQAEYEALEAEHATLVDENTGLKGQLELVQSNLTNLQADYEAVQSDLTNLQTDYEAANEELAAIKEVYPPRNFNSRTELVEWREGVGILDYTDIYRGCEKLQEIALSDGYILSVSTFYDYYDEIWYTACLATAGDSIYSLYPDELGLYYEREVILY